MQRSSTNEERRYAAACKASRTENPSKERSSLLFTVKKRYQSEEKLTKLVETTHRNGARRRTSVS